MPRTLFVNLAVEDLDRSVEFFRTLGFTFDPRFTDETATCMLVGEDAYVMLLTQPKMRDFTSKALVDPHSQTEAILALTADSRDEVDALVEDALASGGSRAGEPMDLPFMYGRSFNDPDGHLWEVFHMDTSQVPDAGPAAGAGIAA